MKISEMILKLSQIQEENGDLRVFHKELIIQKSDLVAAEMQEEDIDYFWGGIEMEEGVYI